MIQVVRMTRSVSMPVMRARSGGVGHRPHRLAGLLVRLSSRWTASISSKRGADDDDVLGEDAKRVEQHPRKVDALAEGLKLRAPDDLHQGAHHQHQSERGDYEDDRRSVTQRAEEQPVHPERRASAVSAIATGKEEKRVQAGKRGQGEGEVSPEGHRLPRARSSRSAGFRT